MINNHLKIFEKYIYMEGLTGFKETRKRREPLKEKSFVLSQKRNGFPNEWWRGICFKRVVGR